MNLIGTLPLLILALAAVVLLRHWADSSAGSSVGGTSAPPDQAQESAASLPVQLDPSFSRDAILASIDTGIIAVDSTGLVLACNPAAHSLLGIEQAALIGRRLADFLNTRVLQNLIEQVLISGKAATIEMIVASPEEKSLEAAATLIAAAPASGPGVVLMINDVTHVRQLETLRQDFVANVSHELKTPIASIQGFTETLLDGAIEDHSVRDHFLQIILHQSRRLRTIIEDLLMLARLEASEHDLQLLKSRTAAADLLANIRVASSAMARDRGIRLNLECPDNFIVLANPSLLEQGLINLVDNAIKYTNGTVVTLKAARSGSEAIFSVQDTGPGIAEEHLARLFERFYRVDKGRSRDEGGSGLGLAIVKHIALAHGGIVSVQSSQGAGSIFSIHLGPDSVIAEAKIERKAV